MTTTATLTSPVALYKPLSFFKVAGVNACYRLGTDMLPNDGRLQTETIHNSIYTKICTRVVLNFHSSPCALLAKGQP